jgi:mannose-6-phosphate isomerase-like protein (cupin superfamily)
VSTLFSLAEALDVPVDAFFRNAETVSAESAATRAGDTSAGMGSAAARGAGEAAPLRGEAARSRGEAARSRGAEPSAGGQRQDRYVVRRGDRAAIDIEGGVRWERLTPTPLDDVEFMELIYAPGAESNASLYRHPGFEMVVVLSGRMVIHVGFERYELQPGDSMAFPSTLPHRYVNPGEEEARAVTAILRDGLPGPAHES